MEQRIEGRLEGCQRNACRSTCCDDDRVEEWVNEYLRFHAPMKEHLRALGIHISFVGDRVSFTNCTDGKNCKFLKYAPDKMKDPRPIDCKIFPYAVDWPTIDFDKMRVNVYYWDNSCPLVREHAIPEEFRHEVERIIRRDFKEIFCGADFTVRFVECVYPPAAEVPLHYPHER
jgi:hypothetical protein